MRQESFISIHTLRHGFGLLSNDALKARL
jgi:hypothetical protein